MREQLDPENTERLEQSKNPEWMQNTTFEDLSAFYNQIFKVGECRGDILTEAVTELYLRYEARIREIVNGESKNDVDLQAEAVRLVTRVQYLKVLCEILQNYGFFTKECILPEMESCHRNDLPLWVPGTLFEEIDTAYNKKKSVPAMEWIPQEEGWVLVSELDQLQNAVNYISDSYAKYIKSSAASKFISGELELRLRLSHLTLLYLIQESLVDYPDITGVNWNNNVIYIKQT